MDEILAKLLESELLNDESKTEIAEAFNAAVESLKESQRKELELEVRAELVEQWTDQRDALINAVDEKVTELVAEEFVELRDDVNRFRDLEVEYTEKLIEAKQGLAVQLNSELTALVDKLDSFLEYRVNEEMTELKEDLAFARENKFGRTIFEAFMREFNSSFVDEESVHAKLAMTEDKLTDATERLAEMENEKTIAKREKTLNEVLSPLSGVKREQMEIILQNVETSKLQEAYSKFIGRILKESVNEGTVESAKTLAEQAASTVIRKRKVVTGNSDDKVLAESKTAEKPSGNSELARTLKLAGI